MQILWRMYYFCYMKRIFIFVTLLLFTSCSSQRNIDKLLAEVWDRDQSVRHKMMELTREVSVDGRMEKIDSLLIVGELQECIDAENISIVERILCNGLPKNLNAASYKTIWIVIDHASHEKQEQYLPMVEQMVEMGVIGADEYAVLWDRVRMGQNRPQRYGSQVVQFGNIDMLQIYVYPIENADALDSLRASVGLSPMEEYLDQVTKAIGIEVKYEPEMTVEQFEKLRYN